MTRTNKVFLILAIVAGLSGLGWLGISYVLVLLCQVLGIFFHIMQKVTNLSVKNPTVKPREIWDMFWQEDWPTTATSAGVLALNLLGHYIYFDYLHLTLMPEWYWQIAPFVISLLGGYAGQRIIYKYFGSLEIFVNKRADTLAQQ